LAIVYAIYNNQNTSKEKTFKIGVVAPLTAGATVYGENLVKGIELAKADLGIKGNDYQIIVEDDGGNTAKSASAAQKLINIDGVKAIITVTSGTGNAVQKIASQYGIAHICDCVDTSIATSTGFIYSVLPQEESKAWLREAQVKGIKTVYLITQNQPGANLIREEVVKNAPAYGVKIVGDVKVESTQRDFKTDILKIKSTPADMYFTIVFPPTLDILAKEMKDQGVTNFSSVGLLAISADLSLFEGRWYTDNYLADDNYFAKFTAANPTLRFNARTAPHGYDILNLIVKGHEAGDIVGYIKGLQKYSGKVGVAKKTNQNTFSLPLGIWEIKDGKTVQIKAAI
jgi:ABC-type branched-subunit amino acid transport system substrate-binding protein